MHLEYGTFYYKLNVIKIFNILLKNIEVLICTIFLVHILYSS